MKRLLSVVLLLLAVDVHAQILGRRHGAKFAARRGLLQVGTGVSYLRPDYGPGVGYMVNPFVALDLKKSYVGVEVSGNIKLHTLSTASPNSVTLGLRVGGDLGDRFRIFAKPAIGYGHFSGVTTVASPRAQNYLIYEVGGGVEYRIAEHLNTRVFGAYQIWPKFDGDTTTTYDHGGVLSPVFGGLGIAYRF